MTLFDLMRPECWRGGLIVASPHSGRDYPDWFLRQSRLSESQLRTSEDAFVDRLAQPALGAGAVVLCARVPRSVVDLNRARDELDPQAVAGAVACPGNPRMMAGLGVIPRVVAHGRPIRDRPIAREEAERRLDALWQPYHDALAALMEEAEQRFGIAVLLDMHSMPRDALAHLSPRPEVVIGDRHGRAAAPWLRDALKGALAAEDFRLRMNAPFAGAHVVAAYGAPERGRHALQLEVDRSLYMDEARLAPHGGLARLAGRLGRVYAAVARALPDGLPMAAE